MEKNIEPTYTIKLPTKIDVKNNEIEFSYYLKGDICANQKLIVKFNDAEISDTNVSYPITVSQDKIEYTYLELTDEYVEYKVYLYHNSISAGHYEGNLYLDTLMVEAS